MESWVNIGTQHAALYNIIYDYNAHGCEKLSQGFLIMLYSSTVGFNVPRNTLQVISGTIFTGQMTQPTVSSTEGQ